MFHENSLMLSLHKAENRSAGQGNSLLQDLISNVLFQLATSYFVLGF